ncbi:hypothetical protein L2E82_09144 [Cichorium intybus]|uniref:Uncharacterized protein n=1 Tax=Cichorium intybus TaxID=13427 RepID=A0ACB9G8S7_CICIN|nr:hypothetical protein L2E82_09144 [Cichorium intybus]
MAEPSLISTIQDHHVVMFMEDYFNQDERSNQGFKWLIKYFDSEWKKTIGNLDAEIIKGIYNWHGRMKYRRTPGIAKRFLLARPVKLIASLYYVGAIVIREYTRFPVTNLAALFMISSLAMETQADEIAQQLQELKCCSSEALLSYIFGRFHPKRNYFLKTYAAVDHDLQGHNSDSFHSGATALAVVKQHVTING